MGALTFLCPPPKKKKNLKNSNTIFHSKIVWGGGGGGGGEDMQYCVIKSCLKYIVIEIYICVYTITEGLVYPTQPMPWFLMIWQRKESSHQQQWYWSLNIPVSPPGEGLILNYQPLPLSSCWITLRRTPNILLFLLLIIHSILNTRVCFTPCFVVII